MSDLQDVIVSSSIRAFNAGLATGIIQEKERIISLLSADMCSDWATQKPYCCDGACSAYNDAINLIKGDDNGKDG